MKRWLVVAVLLSLAAGLRWAGGAAWSGPASASAMALGGFNGLAASYLWLQAARREEAGEPYDLLRTARWISALEPKVGSLVDFQADNLAYNVAESFAAMDQSWVWVRAGLDLLYDEGVGRHPADAGLHAALAGLLLNRIADDHSGAGDYYRQAFAREWTGRVGAPPVDWSAVKDATWRGRLDPGTAQVLDTAAGGLDWRSAWAHGYYWAQRGLALEARQAARRRHWAASIAALRGACLDGLIVTDPAHRWFVTAPQTQVLAALDLLYEAALADLPTDPGLRANRDNWQPTASLLRYASSETRASAATRAAVHAALGADRALLAEIAVDRLTRARLCTAAGASGAARINERMARAIAEAAGADWQMVSDQAADRATAAQR